MRKLLILSLFLNGFTVSLAEVTVEAQGICVECSTNDLTKLKEEAEKIEKTLSKNVNICETKGLINTKRQAQIHKWVPKNDDPDLLEYLFRQTSSCLYGLGEGAIFAVVSLAKGVSDLVGGAVNTGTDVVKFFKDNKASDLVKNFDIKKLSSNVIKTTGKTMESISSSISKMSRSLQKTYQEIGLQGTLSMIGFEAWQKSPHHVIKNFLKKAIDGLSQYLSKESDRFNCLDNESKAELMCKMISSVGTDVAIGTGISKLILFGKGAVTSAKAKLATNATKTKVDDQIVIAAETATKNLSQKEVSGLIKSYHLPKNLSSSASKLIAKASKKDQQSILNLLESANSSNAKTKKSLTDLIDSLGELPKESLQNLDVATVMQESKQALNLGQAKIIDEWVKIVKSGDSKGALACFKKVKLNR